MPCGQCGTENPPGTKFCSNCGTALAQVAQPPVAQPPGYGVQSPGFGGTVSPQAARPPASISIDFRRLGTGDLVALGGSVLLFISLFLSWYTVKVSDQFGSIGGSTSALGTGAGGWRVLILVLDILIILYLFVRTLTPRWTAPSVASLAATHGRSRVAVPPDPARLLGQALVW